MATQPMANTYTWRIAQLERDEKVLEIHAALNSQIDQQRTPTTAQGLPWQ